MEVNYIVLFLLLIICIGPIGAKGQRNPSDFFPKNFITEQDEASGQIKARLDPKSWQTNPARTGRNVIPLAKESLAGDFLKTVPHTVNATENSGVDSSPTSILKAGIPVKSVGVILNSSKTDHFLQHLQVTIDSAIKHNLPISRVYAVGDIPRINRDKAKFDYSAEMFKFWVLDGVMIPTARIPKKYEVKLSPTWIFSTSKGEILVEGILSPQKLLNAKGEFVGEHFRAISTEIINSNIKSGVKNEISE